MSSSSISTTSDPPVELLAIVDENGGIQVLDDEVLDLIAGGQSQIQRISAQASATLGNNGCGNNILCAETASAAVSVSAVQTGTLNR